MLHYYGASQPKLIYFENGLYVLFLTSVSDVPFIWKVVRYKYRTKLVIKWSVNSNKILKYYEIF